MGVQYPIHDLLLKGLPNRDCDLGSRTASLEKRRDNKSAGPETGELEGWMDAAVGECSSMDYVRRTMLNQEKMFNEQVLELHRLYRVQTALMSELSKGLRSWSSSAAAVSSSVGSDAKSGGGLWSSASDSRVNVLSSTGGSAEMGRRCWYSVDMESRVVVPCSSTVQVPPHPIYEEHNNRVAVEKMEDSDLDLTLRIGSICSSRAKARKLEAGESGSKDARLAAMAFTSAHGMPWKKDHAHAGHVISFHTPRDAAGLQSPPWLPQALSLNRT